MRLVGYKLTETATKLKSQIVRVLDKAEQDKRDIMTRNLISDDSVLGHRSGFEEIQLVEINTEDRNVQPLSQYVHNELSQLIDSDMMTFDNGAGCSETESEDDTSETEQERVAQLKQVNLTLSSFKNYLLWSTKHTVKVELVKSGFIDTQQVEAPIKEE